MKSRQPFEEIDEEAYIFGKFTHDGGCALHFMEEQHLPSHKRIKSPEEKVDVDIKALGLEETISIAEMEENAQNQGETAQSEELVEGVENAQKKPRVVVKMTLRELFDCFYEGYAKMKWKARWSKMMGDFAPYIEDVQKRKEFLQVNFKRKRHNERARRLRMIRKMSVNGFNYFVTFTYSDEKMDVETFKKRLKAYLKNNVTRHGWKYIGVWEGWDGSVRLHFHALMFIDEDAMPGENFVETKYNPVTKQMETHTRNTEFNEKFGFSTIEEIIPQMKNSAYEYIMKYMNKGGKMMMSRNCPTFVKGAVQKKHLLGPTNEDETTFLMAEDAEVVLESGEVVRLERGNLHKVLPNATTCN